MAKVVNPLHSDKAAGILGNAVYRWVKGKGIVQSRPDVPYVDSTARIAIRTTFNSVTPLWKLLTDQQRTDWRDYALLHPYTDRFGRRYHLSGSQQFVKLNCAILYHAGSLIYDPPVYREPRQALTPSASQNGVNILLAWTPSPPFDELTDVIDVWQHYRQSVGRGPDRKTAVIIGTPLCDLGEFVLFAYPPGNCTWWFRGTDPLTGIQSPETSCSLTITKP